MPSPPALAPSLLCRRCASEEIPFETTDDAEELHEVVGQERAVEAVRFGIAIPGEGYNLFAIGPSGIGKHTLLRAFLARQAATRGTPADWCYVHNRADAHRPRALQLPAGRGAGLRADMERVAEELRVALRAAFQSEDYRTRRHQAAARLEEQQEAALAEVRSRARQRHVVVTRTNDGLRIAPMRGEEPLSPDEYRTLPPEEQARLHAEMEAVSEELQALLGRFREWEREREEAGKALDRETAAAVARRVVDGVRDKYRDLPDVLAWLAEVELDVVENADDLQQEESDGVETSLRRALSHGHEEGATLRRYRVNVVVDNAGGHGAPVVYEDHPTCANLVGSIEHLSRFGALVTDFTLIKPGALHRARGGYLLLDALEVLRSPLSWEALKRVVRSGEIRIESLAQLLGLVSTVSLEPEPIPTDGTKIVLVGERLLYYLLATVDPDFLELFKVLVDFEESMERGPDSHRLYARLVASVVRKAGLRPLRRDAVARVIEQAARYAGDAEKLSVHMRPLVDLLREADFQAGAAAHPVVTADDVQHALDAQLHRAGRVRERLLEEIRRESLLIATAGVAVGQVNGLSVFQLGEHWFGHPMRISARVRMGKGELVDIERESALGRPLHSKGVLILGGFLGGRYATRVPLSLAASLVFEQTYGPVEGDSASLAETCVLLSALAGVPLRQSLAVTGSVNQHGQVQAIGGVNEKVEGFFDVCRERGLDGEQGVIIPAGNVKNLMLRRDVVDAAEAGRFRLHAVSAVDDALELLTGRPAGVRDSSGQFPEGSVNALVEARLIAFAEDARRFFTKEPER